MKDIIKVLVQCMLSMVSFVIVTAFDIAALTIALLSKGVRWVTLRLEYRLVDRNADCKEARDYTWVMINRAYKGWIDELYPTKKDEP